MHVLCGVGGNRCGRCSADVLIEAIKGAIEIAVVKVAFCNAAVLHCCAVGQMAVLKD